MSTPHRDPAAPTSRNVKRSTDERTHATPADIVDALNGLFGKQAQTHARAVHAKGIVLEGSFRPAPTAASISKAPHLQSAVVPVTVRFSNFPGTTALSDADPNASPRGLAVKFRLPDGSQTDIVAHSFNGFPVATSDDFRLLLLALGSSGPGAASPTPLDRFLATYPRAKAFLEGQKSAPVSYGTLPYFGVNSFKFTSAEGDVTHGRYRIAPTAGERLLTPEQLSSAGPNYLQEEIRARVARDPVSFTLGVQVAGEGDVIDDPSIAWPDTRETIVLGTLEVTTAVADSEAAERALIFSPAIVPEGIEPADPMIQVRDDAYGVSYARRHA